MSDIVVNGVTINEEFAKKVLGLVDQGLSNGMGNGTPGAMCIEAVVAYASGEEINDHPKCVDHSLANQKINLNDSYGWESSHNRAVGLRRLAIAQLGTGLEDFSILDFGVRLTTKSQPLVNEYNAAAFGKAKAAVVKATEKATKFSELREVGFVLNGLQSCFGEISTLTGYASLLKNMDPERTMESCLKEAAEVGVQILIEMNTPGSKYLYLTEGKAA